jgi:hypothetical protein
MLRTPSRSTNLLLSRHQAPPEPQKIPADASDATEIEELRFAVHPMIMVHWNLYHSRACILQLFHQLNADDPAVRSDLDRIEHVAADESEIAIDIPQLEAER